jgi:hypothetical protein
VVLVVRRDCLAGKDRVYILAHSFHRWIFDHVTKSPTLTVNRVSQNIKGSLTIQKSGFCLLTSEKVMDNIGPDRRYPF